MQRPWLPLTRLPQQKLLSSPLKIGTNRATGVATPIAHMCIRVNVSKHQNAKVAMTLYTV